MVAHETHAAPWWRDISLWMSLGTMLVGAGLALIGWHLHTHRRKIG
jgi:hypothetical protein